MNTEKELNKIESRINSDSFGRGLGEIYVAVVLFFLYGIKYVLPEDTNYRFIIILGVIFLLGRVLHYFRSKFVFPRIGYIKKDNFSKRELLKVLYLIPACVLLALPILVAEMDHGFTALASFTKTNIALIMGASFILFFFISAKISNVKRLKYYGVVFGLTIALKQFFPINMEHMKLVFAIMLSISGSVLFHRFLKKHPLKKSESNKSLEGISQ